MERPIHIFSDIVFPAINFMGFVGILFYVLKNPVKKFFFSRSQLLRRNISESAESFQKAKLQFDEAQRKLTQIEQEKTDLLKKTKNEIEILKKKSSTAFEALVETLKAEHNQKIEEELKKAQRHLKSVAIQKIVESTKALFKKDLSSVDHQRLVDEYAEVKDLFNESKERGALRSGTC